MRKDRMKWLGLLLGLLLLPTVRAEILILDIPITANDTPRTLAAYHPSAGASNSEVGQTFTVPADSNYRLDRAVFEIDRLSSSVSVRLRSTLHSSLTGTYGSTAVPSDTASPLSTSDWVLAASIPAGSRTRISFYYSGSPELVLNTQYAITVQMDTTGTIDLGYNVYFDGDNGYGGNLFIYSLSSYEGGANDHGVELYGSKIESFTGAGSSQDSLLDNLASLPSNLVSSPGAILFLAGATILFLSGRKRGR